MFKMAGFAIQKISTYFTDVLEGERLAMWAANDMLLIAIHVLAALKHLLVGKDDVFQRMLP